MKDAVQELFAQKEIELEKFELKCGRELSEAEKQCFRSGFLRGLRRRDEQLFGQWKK